MSDDLVKRLSFLAERIELGDRLRWGEDSAALRDAKDRIEELEAKLAKIICLAGDMADAIEDQIDTCDASMDEQIAVKNYRATLAELTGGKDAAAAIRKGGE